MCYQIDRDYDNYYSLSLDGADLANKMPLYSHRFRAKPRLKSWIPPKAFFYPSDNYKLSGEVLPDITTWALGNLVLNAKAFEFLKDILNPSGEFLQLIVDTETYYMFNTLFVIPELAINTINAFEIVNSGVHLGQGNAQFDESLLANHCLFKSHTNKLTYSFATNDFKSLYENHSLTGLVFNEI